MLSIRLYYDWHTYVSQCHDIHNTHSGCSDALMEEGVRMMQQSIRASPSVKKRAKSVYAQRNLGTIKDRKREKLKEKEVSNGETILRILRMRGSFRRTGETNCIAPAQSVLRWFVFESIVQVVHAVCRSDGCERQHGRPIPGQL